VQGEPQPALLAACYRNALDAAASLGARSIAFPRIATSYYGYPIYAASLVAFRTVREWLEASPNSTIERIIFVTGPHANDVAAELMYRAAHLCFPEAGSGR
jgi:O-acetyl-ADP-ribose deacetylase